MVSGVLRLLELALLIASGLFLFSFHVGLDTHLIWQYPLVIVEPVDPDDHRVRARRLLPGPGADAADLDRRQDTS